MSEQPHVHYEASDVRPGPVVRWGIVLALTVAIVAGALIGFYRLLLRMEERQDPPRRPAGVYDSDRVPPEPQLQKRPTDDLLRDREEQRAQLDQVGTDPKSGTTHVRIGEAMKRWVQEQAASPAPPSPAPQGSPRPAASVPTESAPAPTLPHEPGGTP